MASGRVRPFGVRPGFYVSTVIEAVPGSRTMRAGQTTRLLALLLGLAATQPALPLESVDSVRQVLLRMATAADTLSYRGVATHEQAGTLTTLRIVRAVRDGRQWERLEYLDGPPQEIIRRAYDRAECDRIPATPSAAKAAGLAGREPGGVEHYLVSLREDGRVAGRRVRQVHLQPRDAFRYGHLLGLDQATGLLLQDQVFDGEGNLVERFQFTSIAIGAVIDEAELEPRFSRHLVVANPPCSDPGQDAALAPVEVAWVPPGFELSGPPRIFADGVRQLHYSDGFSSFSIFIDPTSGSGVRVEARRGPTAAFLAHGVGERGGYAVCVVGELPLLTARRIAAGVAPGGAQPLPAAAADGNRPRQP